MKMEKKHEYANYVEVDSIQDANLINHNVYRLSERLSAKFGRWIFIKRQRKV